MVRVARVSCFILPDAQAVFVRPRHGADYPGGRRQGQVLQYRLQPTYIFRPLFFAIFASSHAAPFPLLVVNICSRQP